MMGRQEQLRNWLNDLESEQQELMVSLEPLLRRKDQLRQKIELVERLLSLESDSRVQSDPAHRKNGAIRHAAALGTGGNRTGSELQEVVREILEEYGKPMHISDIRSALLDRGVPIPGKGTDANIIVHLRRAPDVFERKNRGTYGLVGARGNPTP
jgi:hypothetical protein